MISIYKFEDYKAYNVSTEVLVNSIGGKLKKSFREYYIHDNNNILLVPIPKNTKILSTEVYINKECGCLALKDIETKELSYNDTLYIHSNCSIPRNKVTQKYKRVIKPERADKCVVPKFGNKSLDTSTVAVFINHKARKVYWIEYESLYINNKWEYRDPIECREVPIGTPVFNINPNLMNSTIVEKKIWNRNDIYTNENWNSFLHSTLIYYGQAVKLYTKITWIADYLYNKLHNIVYEEDLLHTLGDFENKFTKEVYDNIKSMLKSKDNTTIGIGLKLLAELDYNKYRNTAIHLLCSDTSWQTNSMKTSSSVKFMLKHLNLWNYVRENFSENIDPEDFKLLLETIKEDLVDNIDYTQKIFEENYPFCKLQLNYTYNIIPKLKD